MVQIPPITNWSVFPQNGDIGYFDDMNVWIEQGNTVIPSANASIVKMNEAIAKINNIAENAINAITFDNIAQLKLNSNIGRVDVLGYYEKGDGGGGTFYWDSTSTETDNGGTIIQATGVTTGRWKRIFNIFAVDVRWFGAYDCINGGVLDSYLIIQNAIDSFSNVYIDGLYYTSKPLHFKNPKQYFIGSGTNTAAILPFTTFSGITVGGHTDIPLIWYQPPSSDWDIVGNFIAGGKIADITLHCSDKRTKGIIFNNVNQQQVIDNVHIYRPITGIEAYFGWTHNYNSVYIQGAEIASVILGEGTNGTTFNGCFLMGWNFATDRTQVHLDVRNQSFGNCFNGGAIELCDAAARVTGESQIIFNGTDFEEVHYKFGEFKGLFSGATPVTPNGGSSFNACSFIGVPSDGGITTEFASVSVNNCFFKNNEAVPTGSLQYPFRVIQYGKNYGDGYLPLSISEQNNIFYGWGGRVSNNNNYMNTVLKGNLSAGDVFVPMKDWTPILQGFVITGTTTIYGTKYAKEGNKITLTGTIQADSISTIDMTSYIKNLPFSPFVISIGSAMSSGTANDGATILGYTNGRVYFPTKSWGNSVSFTITYFIN